MAVCLHWAAVILAYAHWIFGTLVFSSTLFIGTLDGLGVIARYLASALVCRMILLVELAGITGEQGRDGLEGRGGPNTTELTGRNLSLSSYPIKATANQTPRGRRENFGEENTP